MDLPRTHTIPYRLIARTPRKYETHAGAPVCLSTRPARHYRMIPYNTILLHPTIIIILRESKSRISNSWTLPPHRDLPGIHSSQIDSLRLPRVLPQHRMMEEKDGSVPGFSENILHLALQFVMAPFQLHHVHPVNQVIALHCLGLLLTQKLSNPQKEEKAQAEEQTNKDYGDRGDGERVLYLVRPAFEPVHIVIVDGSSDDQQDRHDSQSHQFSLEACQSLLGNIVPSETRDDGDIRHQEQDDIAELVADIGISLVKEERDDGQHPQGHFLLPDKANTQ